MGWGMAVVEGDAAVESESGYQEAGPTTSNNVAEYLGICMALQRAIKAAQDGQSEITIRGDSKLVIEQLNERWKARSGLYMQAWQEAKTLLQELRNLCPGVRVEWMPGIENIHADKASRVELEKRGIPRGGR
jgi:ribonuclease HI